KLVIERGAGVELLHVIPVETGAGGAAGFLRFGLCLFALGEADAIRGGEAPPRRVHPRVADAGMNDVPIQDPGLVVPVPASAGVPEKLRSDVPLVIATKEIGGDIQRW